MTQKQAGILLLFLLSVVTLFHFLVLLEWIPYGAVWAGRLKSREEMYVFETVSLVINALLIFVVAQQSGVLRSYLPGKLRRVILWFFVALFALNTFGNLFAVNIYERVIGTLLTLLCALLCGLLARKPAGSGQ